MKKGEKVLIKEGTEVQKRQNSWTERNLYGKVTIPAGTIMIHVSMYEKIKTFAPIVTCFSKDRVCENSLWTDYVYGLALKKDLTFGHYDNVDYRIDLGSISNEDAELVYLGTLSSKDKLSFAKEYKGLEKKLQKALKED